MDYKALAAAGILQCPVTREPLKLVGDELRSSTRSYAILDGVPVLVDGEQSVFSPTDISRPGDGPGGQGVSWKRKLVRRLLPSRTPIGDTRLRFQRFIGEVRQGRAAGPSRVLVIGGGQLGQGTAELIGVPDLAVVETDVYIGPRTAIVCDGHHLPFADESFDGVVIQAVLEHVVDPVLVVAEIHRVLKPTGVVYAETPFMQQVHEGPYDFTRWTEIGHRRLFRMFKTIDTGVTAGPAVVLLWSIGYFARSFPRRTSTQLAVEKLATVCFVWLKPLDARLVSRPGATDGASGVYFLGLKADVAVDDAEVLAGYRGTIGVPVRRARRGA
jgi:SAM-dependent methyltransferase/uncharacterized protein YbaR (Trm112 family)